MPRQQFLLREYISSGREILCTIGCIRKIIYNTGDIIWMKNDKVIAVSPKDHHGHIIKYTDDILIEIDAVKFPELTNEAKTYLNRKRN